MKRPLLIFIMLLMLSQAWGASSEYATKINGCKTWIDHVHLVNEVFDTGRLPDLAAAYDSAVTGKPKDPMLLCAYAVTVGQWNYLWEHHMVAQAVDWKLQKLARQRIETAMHQVPHKAFPIMTMI